MYPLDIGKRTAFNPISLLIESANDSFLQFREFMKLESDEAFSTDVGTAVLQH